MKKILYKPMAFYGFNFGCFIKNSSVFIFFLCASFLFSKNLDQKSDTLTTKEQVNFYITAGTEVSGLEYTNAKSVIVGKKEINKKKNATVKKTSKPALAKLETPKAKTIPVVKSKVFIFNNRTGDTSINTSKYSFSLGLVNPNIKKNLPLYLKNDNKNISLLNTRLKEKTYSFVSSISIHFQNNLQVRPPPSIS